MVASDGIWDYFFNVLSYMYLLRAYNPMFIQYVNLLLKMSS